MPAPDSPTPIGIYQNLKPITINQQFCSQRSLVCVEQPMTTTDKTPDPEARIITAIARSGPRKRHSGITHDRRSPKDDQVQD